MNSYPSARAEALPNQGVESKKNKALWDFFRKFDRAHVHVLLLLLLGAAMLVSNPWFTEVDDECAVIDRAARPISDTIRMYFSGAGEHEHPPLYDLILHGWLRLTHGQQGLLRVPSVAFYLAGAWILASAVRRKAGNAAGDYTLLLIFLWPFGFHFGRLAIWYSFCFFLVALITSSYLRYLESSGFGSWCRLIAFSVLLVYTNYFGWVLLGCLALDFIIQNRKIALKALVGLAGSGALLMAAYVPIARAFFGELHGVEPGGPIRNMLFNGIYDLYCVFASESVAPWFWGLGVTVATAIVLCLLVTITSVRSQTRRFLLYFVGLLAVMTLLGIANTKRMLFISPWLILPVGVALGERTRKGLRPVLGGALLVIAAIGWYGIFARNLYAAPHWVEPWERIAQNAANVVRAGGVVIGNNPSFFFYLTYDLAGTGDKGGGAFEGLLPDSIRHSNVYDVRRWIEANRPLKAETMFIAGMPYPDALRNEADWLGHQCVREDSQRLVHDPGAEWKQRFAPETGQVPWRIEIGSYSCR